MRHRRVLALSLIACLTFNARPSRAAEDEEPTTGPKRPARPVFSVEVKTAYRYSSEVDFAVAAPVTPDFLRPGETTLHLRTPDAGGSFEVSNVALGVAHDLTPDIAAAVKVHVLDLHARNPSSTRERVFVREAWVRFGHKYEALAAAPGSSFYALVGLAPRFSKQQVRQFESYGLWGTAVGRFEQTQLQVGGSFGKAVYWRAHVANRNPVFLRDTNALAGDNGTPERVPGSVDPIFESGFPILYDTLPQDVTGEVELGGGLGVRILDEDGENGVDVLGWYFRGQLEDRARIRNTFYEGDLELLRGNHLALDFSGDDKTEYGANLEAKFGRLHLFGQYVQQEIAGLERNGLEAEAALRVPLGGLFLSGDRPVLNWVSFAFRYSNVDNQFTIPKGFVAPSMGWDWRKFDFGIRVGIIRDVDLTAEHSRHDMITAKGTFHPDETLVTLRVGI